MIHYRDEIKKLCQRALKHESTRGIPSERVQRYAELCAFARAWDEGERVSEEHTRRALLESSANNFGYVDGYANGIDATLAIGRAREFTQQIHKKAESILHATRDLADKYGNRFNELPQGVRDLLPPSELDRVVKSLALLVRGTELPDRRASKYTPDARPTAIEQTLLWWALTVPRYAGKWHHMLSLAQIWGITKTAGLDDFKRSVRKVKQRKTQTIDGRIRVTCPPRPTPQ